MSAIARDSSPILLARCGIRSGFAEAPRSSNNRVMLASPPRAVLWDLDGTLIDSAEHHWMAWREIMAHEGHPVTPADFTSSFGHRNDTILRGLLGADLSDGEVERIAGAKEALYRTLVRERGLAPLPGAVRWLEQLRGNGWRQAVASSAPAANIAAAMEAIGLAPLFEALVSADEVGVGKPDPAVFLAAADRVGVKRERCVVVEDAPAGLLGARRAGMRCVGVLSPHHPELTADLVVDSLESLPIAAFEDLLGDP
jgi:HAD superfamily hydrolase (TIGR01509 family)